MRAVIIVAALSVAVVSPSIVTAQVRVVNDVDYVETADYPNRKDRLDIYVPAGATNAPVIVSVHGGLLRQGDRSEEAHVGQRLAAAGYVTVIPSYRLSPGVMHPAHVEDVAAAVAWTVKHIADYGGDPSRIVLTGHSAGAYLIALIGLDPRYLAVHGMKPSQLAGLAPVSSFYYVEREGVAPDRPKDTWGTDPAAWKAASVPDRAPAGTPAILMVYADRDEPWRRQQHVELAAALRASGAQVDLQLIADRSHMGIWQKFADEGDPAAAAILGFADKVTKPR